MLSNKVYSKSSSYFTEKIKFSLNRDDQSPEELQITTLIHNDEFNLEGNYKFVDSGTPNDLSSIGFLGDVRTNFTDKSGLKTR